MIGINQDNRADGTGKAGLTFQAIGYYTIRYNQNDPYFVGPFYSNNAGGWRDTLLRKNLNNESTGAIWNAIQSTDFKNNITPVLKITNSKGNWNAIQSTNSKVNSDNTYNASSITVDKLFILSPSEMSMPIIKNYNAIFGDGVNQSNANVHYYDSDSYNSTIKSSSDGSDGNKLEWWADYNYLYDGNAYQWWMLPAGSRKMSNGNQAYHNTDSYSYCGLINAANSSNNDICHYNDHYYDDSYWFRSSSIDVNFATYSTWYDDDDLSSYISSLSGMLPIEFSGVVVSFSF